MTDKEQAATETKEPEVKKNKDGNPIGCQATPEMIAADRKQHFENFLKTKSGRDKLNGKRKPK